MNLRHTSIRLVVCALAIYAAIANAQTKPDIRLPLKEKSVRFAVIGDSGTGEKDQYEIAKQMDSLP